MIIKTTTEKTIQKAKSVERRGRCGPNKRSLRANERGGVGVVYTIIAGSIAIPALVFASMYALSSNKSFERSTVRFDRPGTYVGGGASGGGASSSEVTLPTATSGGQGGDDVLHNTGAVVTNEASVGTIVGSVQSPGQPRSGLDNSYAVAIAGNEEGEGNGENEDGEDGDSSNNSRSLTDDEFSEAETRGESSGGGSSRSASGDSTGSERSFSTRAASLPTGPQSTNLSHQDWCTSVPDVCLISGVQVGSACKAHDICYSADSSTDRAECDQQLQQNVTLAGGSWICGVYFYLGVQFFGSEYYLGSGEVDPEYCNPREGPCPRPSRPPPGCSAPQTPASGPAVPTQRSAGLSEDLGQDREARSSAQQSLGGTDCASAAAAEQQNREELYDAALAALIVAQKLVEGDNYGAGGAIVGIVISYNTGDSLAGGAAAGAQIGTLVGLLISGDEEALRDWVAAQATNYAVGQVVGSQNAGFVIGFVTDILDENYAGALGLYLGTIACGPPCAAFLEFVFTGAYGDYKEKKAKKKLRIKIQGWQRDAIANAQAGVAEAVQLAAEQGLCSTVPPIHIPAPDGDPDSCTKDYFDGFSKLSALAACGNKIKIVEYDRGGPNGGTEDFAVVYFEPECFDWQGRTCKKRRLTRSSLLDGSLDHLMQCDDPKPVAIEGRTSTRLWRDAMYDECLSQRPGDPSLHGEQWFVEKQVRHLAYDLVNGKAGAEQRLQQFLQGAAAAAWQRAYNEAVAKFCPQGADTPAALGPISDVPGLGEPTYGSDLEPTCGPGQPQGQECCPDGYVWSEGEKGTFCS